MEVIFIEFLEFFFFAFCLDQNGFDHVGPLTPDSTLNGPQFRILVLFPSTCHPRLRLQRVAKTSCRLTFNGLDSAVNEEGELVTWERWRRDCVEFECASAMDFVCNGAVGRVGFRNQRIAPRPADA